MRACPVVAVALAVALQGCGPEQLDASKDSTTFEVTWKPEAKRVEESVIDATILEASLAEGRFVFPEATAEITALAPGDFVVLGGVGVFKVLSNDVAAGARTLKTEVARLTDVIQDANISWTRTFTSQAETPRTGTGLGETDLSVIKQGLSGSYDNGTLSFSGNIGGFDTSFTVSPSGQGHQLSLTAKYEKDDALANIAGTGTLLAFRNEGHITIIGSELQEWTVLYERVEGDFVLNAGGVKLGTGEQAISIPARISVPIRLGPIPASISLGGKLEVSTALSAQSTARIKARIQFKGTFGLRAQKGVLEPVGTLDSQNLSYEDGDSVSTVDSGFSALMTFPELAFGIGIAGTGGEAYVKFKQEAITNMTMRYDTAGPFPVITGSCIESGVNLGAYYGGALKVLDFTLAEGEKPIVTKIMPKVRKGNACE